MNARGQILLVNPWIYDFAAHNLWIEPLGLLTIATALRNSGYGVTLLDCLAPHPGAPPPRPDGSGKFLKTFVDKPEAVAFIPRRYGRYGWPVELFDAALAVAPLPDLVLVASGMTYWYPGVVEAVRRVRARFGAVPVALGGVYATLCPEHARQHSSADRVIAGPGVVAALRLADEVSGHDSEPERYANPRAWPPPAHELPVSGPGSHARHSGGVGAGIRPFAGLLTSWGCPYRCTYCASHRLQPEFVRRDPAAVVAEIATCARRGVRDFAFYDDALLLDAERHIAPILEGVLARGLSVRFHTPNGLHAGLITAGLAALMRRAGFATLRLSLETTDAERQRASGGKVSTGAFERAVRHLQMAGFGSGALGAYLLAGLPGQPLSEVEASVRYVQALGVQAKLALFSPIPGTPDGDRALPPGADPLLHNDTVYPYLRGDEYVGELQRIKQLAKEGNARLKRKT
jgi:radical SAM superfamily enzyme YgiQ (UPF0313 family)